MFPEYVEKYNQQLQLEQHISEHVSSEASQVENSKSLLDKGVDLEGDVKRVDAVRDRRKDKKQSLPTWVVVLLVSMFGIIMSLPLLQL